MSSAMEEVSGSEDIEGSAISTSEPFAPASLSGIRKRKRNVDAPRAAWDSRMEEFALEFLKDAEGAGQRAGTSWKDVTFTNMQSELNSRFGANLSVGQVKSKIQNLRRTYLIFRHLKDLSGWGWDDENGELKADDETWEAVEKQYKVARGKRFPIYWKANELWEHSCATGLRARTVHDARPDPTAGTDDAPSDDEESDMPSESDNVRQRGVHRADPTPSTNKQMISEVCGLLKDMVKSFQGKSEEVQKANDIISANDNIPEHLKIAALLHMADHESFARGVLAASEERLLRMLITKFGLE